MMADPNETEKKSYFDYLFPTRNDNFTTPCEPLLISDSEITVVQPETKYDPTEIFGTDESMEEPKEIPLEDIRRDIEQLKVQYNIVSQSVHENEESVDRLIDSVERVSVETPKPKSWSETFANSKIVATTVVVATTIVVTVPLVTAWFLRKENEKDPK